MTVRGWKYRAYSVGPKTPSSRNIALMAGILDRYPVPRTMQTRAGLAALLIGASSLGAQDTSRTAMLDSLAKQLERVEARIDVLEKQVATEASTGVHSRTGVRMELSGRLIVNGFSDTRRVNNVDNPQFVRPDTIATVPVRGLGMSPRQSMMRLAVIVPDVAGGTFIGDVDADFYGGQQPSTGGRTFPLLRMRTMRMTLRRPNTELMIGQDVPVIAPLNPVSLASIGTPEFAGAGNLWLWLPQIRATAETPSALRLGIQAAILAPTSGDPAGVFDTDFDPAEHSTRPYFQGRLHARWGENETAGEVGCGAHVGWLNVAPAVVASGGSLVRSDAAACDMHMGLERWLEVRGEAYTGAALRGLGGGGIGQGIGPGNVAVRDRGGWAQLNLKPTFKWSTGAGCGIDDPNDADLAATARLQNTSCALYLHLRPAGPLLVGFEERRTVTRYTTGSVTNDHLNIGIGFEY